MTTTTLTIKLAPYHVVTYTWTPDTDLPDSAGSCTAEGWTFRAFNLSIAQAEIRSKNSVQFRG